MEKVDIKSNYIKYASGLILVIVLLIGCKDSSVETIANVKVEKSTDSLNSVSINTTHKIDSLEGKEIQITYKYVNAPSGLNFRETPGGKILGKFPHNLRIQILQYTDKQDTIIDGDKEVVGEWVKVRYYENTSYVHDGYLADTYTKINEVTNKQDLAILTMNSYQKDDKKVIPFISLVDNFWGDTYKDIVSNHAVTLNNSGYPKEFYFYLETKQRAQFLKRGAIRETDSLYIYNYSSDRLTRTVVKDIPLFAHPNVYGGPDYITGFDLEKIVNAKDNNFYNSFAYIGTKNPFETGKVKPIIWKSIENSKVPKVKLNSSDFYISNNYEVKIARRYQQDDKNYYYARLYFRERDYSSSIIFITDTDNKVLFQTQIYGSEGASPSMPLNNNVTGYENSNHYTGQLFKNEPSVIFGLYFLSFSCPDIDFIDSDQPSIYTLCDNRH